MLYGVNNAKRTDTVVTCVSVESVLRALAIRLATGLSAHLATCKCVFVPVEPEIAGPVASRPWRGRRIKTVIVPVKIPVTRYRQAPRVVLTIS